MPGPAAGQVVLTMRQRRVLERLVRRRTGRQQEGQRAQLILAAADGAGNAASGRQIGVTRETSRLWRERWRQQAEALLAAEAAGDDGALAAVIQGVLADAPRIGAPATFGPEQVCGVVALACEPPEASGRPITHWTPRELADEAVGRGIVPRISPSSVARFLKGGRAPAAPESLLADADAGRPTSGTDR